MQTMLELVAVPGIAGTDSEILTSRKVYELLSEIPYFKANRDRLKLVEIWGDPHGRCFVSAMLESARPSKKTIIITGHTDVVDIEEYGHLKQYAFDPVEFTKKVRELKLDEDSIADLKSGDWIFGRGVADMKFGIALCIELMREYSARNDLNGNILFLAVPSEESNSEGMCAAADHLAELQQNHGYEFTTLLLAECYGQKTAEDKTRYIHIGACGKIMPMFFFAGKETHVSDPLNGIDPVLMASEVNRLINLNTDFCESSKGVTTPPPICLKQKDLKELYSVQTPLYAAAYYNLITLSNDIEVLMEKLKKTCVQGFENALELMNLNHRRYEDLMGGSVDKLIIKPLVLTFEELYGEVKNICGAEFDAYLEDRLREWDESGIDIQEKAINIVKEVYDRYPDKKPMIIISFIPPFYPDYYPDESSGKMINALKLIDEIIRYAKVKYNEPFVKEDYYMGISDLSYTGMKDSEAVRKVYRNMPGADRIYKLPVESLSKLDIPGIVLGAYGKDVHKYTERLNISFSFGVLPDIYEYAIDRLLTS